MLLKPAILIIDDDRVFTESLSAVLSDDFKVITASAGEDGLFVVKTHEISLILLDLKMPGINGLQVLERVKAVKPDLPIFIITGNGCYESAKRCADLNVQGFIEKPVDVEALLKRIKSVLNISDAVNINILRAICGKQSNAEISGITQKIIQYIHINYHRDFSREEMADDLGLSPDYISRQFRKSCECTLMDFINSYRIYKSVELLTRSDKKIGEVALAVGIPDLNYFCRLFKKHTGYTPESFRK